MPDRERVIAAVVRARRSGCTLRQAAAMAGVHVATLCRWQAADPKVRQALVEAVRSYRRSVPEGPRPSVVWRRDCPLCQAKIAVRTTWRGLRFWRCGRWPLCRWASWRPRAPRNCRKCGAPCYWSHSRKSISCSACGLRTMTHSLRTMTH
jgi:hypothetical protein